MNDLLKNQRINKRRYSGTGSKGNYGLNSECDFSKQTAKRKFLDKPAYRPARIVSLSEQNSRFIEKVKQEPVSQQRRKHKFSNRSFFHFRGRENGSLAGSAGTGGTRIGGESWFSSFALPAISVAGLFFVVLGIFFIIYSQGGIGLDWTGRNVINSGDDKNVRYNLALYAGVNSHDNQAEGQAAGVGNSSGEAIPLDLTETFEWKSYKVKRGDSVSKIAAAFSISMDAIIASNGIKNARALREGEQLRIPNMDGIPYTVKNGDSLSLISSSMGVPLEAILDANDIQSDKINAGMTLFIPGARMNKEELKLALGELFVYPLKGAKLSSPFGWRDDPISGVRRHHAALDLSAPHGTPVKAAMDGKVLATGFNGTYGNYIIISHPGGYQTMYAHLNTYTVRKGDSLSQGTQIGTVGNTGYSTGPHLHFAIFRNSRPVNPLDYLNTRK